MMPELVLKQRVKEYMEMSLGFLPSDAEVLESVWNTDQALWKRASESPFQIALLKSFEYNYEPRISFLRQQIRYLEKILDDLTCGPIEAMAACRLPLAAQPRRIA